MSINTEVCRRLASDVHDSYRTWFADQSDSLSPLRRERAERLLTSDFRICLAKSIEDGVRTAKESRSRSSSRNIAFVASSVMEEVKRTIGSVYVIPPIASLQVLAEDALTRKKLPKITGVNDFHGYETIAILVAMLQNRR